MKIILIIAYISFTISAQQNCDSLYHEGKLFADSSLSKRFIVPGIISGACLGPIAMIALPPIAFNWKKPKAETALINDSCFTSGYMRRARFKDMNSALFGSSMGCLILLSLFIALSDAAEHLK
jgi:hypothetical protein